jgi:hypothetical protein
VHLPNAVEESTKFLDAKGHVRIGRGVLRHNLQERHNIVHCYRNIFPKLKKFPIAATKHHVGSDNHLLKVPWSREEPMWFPDTICSFLLHRIVVVKLQWIMC